MRVIQESDVIPTTWYTSVSSDVLLLVIILRIFTRIVAIYTEYKCMYKRTDVTVATVVSGVLVNVFTSFQSSVMTFLMSTFSPTAHVAFACVFHSLTTIAVMESFTVSCFRVHGIPPAGGDL